MQHQALRAIPLHLGPGSDIRGSLEALAARESISGFVLGVVGNLSQAAFQCPGQPEPTLLQGDLEIITLQGTVSPRGVHLHLSFSDGACQVWGGHLENGTLVQKGAEVLIGVLAAAAAEPEAEEPQARHLPQPRTLSSAEPRVAIAVRAGCPYSARALRMLRTLGIPYQVVSPNGDGSLPQVHIDGVFIGGYDALAELHGQGQLDFLRLQD